MGEFFNSTNFSTKKKQKGYIGGCQNVLCYQDAEHLVMLLICLATCWICNFNPQKVREIFNLPEHIEPVVLLPLGYPLDKADVDRHDKGRKKIEEIVHWEKFS
ncbi:MAG: hypothetical protein A2275_09105 [Bacteroidetes bacterium RIFOXYA12_FULL_35_11]|nr:MAG: hypothetical protein A2X01_01150 [Bacteroidetes bacterium GWF2_35_48]OFY73655.1 MAG: hypothetical protein A2275_09105 [Bacteroidetes bacterium RIFOXYA12_FULL_35_11]OFY99897.1 MAG: hypothetical protein A2491_01300 [Bacteroidetes bacterium RIFOXYC12_FULL_35_7]